LLIIGQHGIPQLTNIATQFCFVKQINYVISVNFTANGANYEAVQRIYLKNDMLMERCVNPF